MIKPPPPTQILHDFSFLDNPPSSSKSIDVLIVLNQPIFPEQFLSLRSHSHFLLFADGGSNRVYDSPLRSNSDAIPDAIVGDLDSIREEVLEFYVSKGAKECRMKSQYHTDFQKAFLYGIKLCSQRDKQNEKDQLLPKSHVFCLFGAFGGRIDQTLSSIHNAVKFTNSLPHIEIILCDPHSLMIPLKPTLPEPADLIPQQVKSTYTCHRIVSSQKYELEDGCALIPINTPSRFIVSQGLKWDLGDQISQLKFGDFISSSNRRVKPEVKVWNTDLIFWSSSLVFKKEENFQEQPRHQ